MDTKISLPRPLTRRGLLVGSVAGVLLPAAARATATNLRLSIAEPHEFVAQPPEKRQLRFDLYKQIGIGTLRVSVGWWDQEIADGVWREPSHLGYLQQAMRNNFRFKMQVATISMPPAWFLLSHPGAQLLNRDHVGSRSDVSYWYPGLHSLIAAKSDYLFGYLATQKLFDAIDYILVDCGPTGEPLYPANWTLGPDFANRETSFWFYDVNANINFAARARAQYGGALSAANLAWGTAFAKWQDVKIPEVGKRPGAMWNDVLVWYRDAKRGFIEWQIANYKTQLERYAGKRMPRLVLMIPGSHISTKSWHRAVADGSGDVSVMLMGDSEYLIDIAERYDCWLQYTGTENEVEVSYLTNYMRDKAISVPMWGENGGSIAAGTSPEKIVDVILRNDLYGFEYIDAGFIFDKDGTSKNMIFKRFAKACASLSEHIH